MTSADTPKQRVARQLQGLMDRHDIEDSAAFERLTESKGARVDQATIRRILQAKARTEPSVATLRKLAEATGETYAQAFPDTEGEVVVEVGGRRLAFRVVDGSPIDEETATMVRERLTVYNAQKVHRAKQKQTRSSRGQPKGKKS